MFRFSIRDINIKKKLKFILTYCYNFCVILFAIFFLKIVIFIQNKIITNNAILVMKLK